VEDPDLPISGAELTVATKVVAAAGKLFGRKDPVAVLKYRESVREELREHLPEGKELPEVMVVRLGREAKYGEPDLRLIPLGASPWFKFEVKDVHDRGLEVVLSIEFVVIKRGKATLADDAAPGAEKVFVVGRIPYERIRNTDWRPDPYYGRSRLYVKYGRRGPCRETVLYEPPSKPGGYLHEIADTKWKGEPSRVKRLRRKFLSIRMSHEDRLNKRKLRDGEL